MVNTPSTVDAATASSVLAEKLAAVLPKGYKFGVYHLSTPPTRSEALFHPPANEPPDRTYRESHFLFITIDAGTSLPDNGAQEQHVEGAQQEVAVFALEIFIFTTAYSSTFFVSKADSSGYLHYLRLLKGVSSPIRAVSSAFLSYLVEHRRRKGRQSVVSLFARAQSQYLFPRSIENSGKHILSDRGLVKWWCRVLDPLLQQTTPGLGDRWGDVRGYLVVPGLDTYETRAFIPRSRSTAEKWIVGHPLEAISHYVAERGSVPPRCLIAQYPDDPKSRFRDELDEEAERAGQESGLWKSVKSLDHFWEMMAFRQECSSGQLTGFIWVVFVPKQPKQSRDASGSHASTSRPPKMAHAKTLKRLGEKEKKDKRARRKPLKGPVEARLPRIKAQHCNHLSERPERTVYYYWPTEGRGGRIVDETDYKRSTELLLQLDFSTLEKAVASTGRWTEEVGMSTTWKLDIEGRQEVDLAPSHDVSSTSLAINDLTGMTKRKRTADGSAGSSISVSQRPSDIPINFLDAGVIRKKQKTSEGGSENRASGQLNDVPSAVDNPAAPKVNVLSGNLVRRKANVT